MMACDICRWRVSGALNRGGSVSAAAERHIEGCPACGAWLARWRSIESRLRSDAAGGAGGGGGAERRAAILRAAIETDFAAPATRRWGPVAAMAVAAVVAGVLLLVRPAIPPPVSEGQAGTPPAAAGRPPAIRRAPDFAMPPDYFALESERLAGDLHRGAAFVLASLTP